MHEINSTLNEDSIKINTLLLIVIMMPMGRLGRIPNLEHKITFTTLCNFQMKIG